MNFEKFSINGLKQTEATEKSFENIQGAFESFRVHKGRVFLLNEHFDRLKEGLEALDINWDDDRRKYHEWIKDICADLPKNKDAFVRLSATESDVLIHVAYIDFFAPRAYKAEIINSPRLQLPEYFERTGFRIKSVDYINHNQAIRKSAGLDEEIAGILLTPGGHVAEELRSNVFWTKDGKLFTPPLETGILAGTMRAYILKNHKIEETLANAETLESADEIVLTNGAGYLRPLSKINGKQKPGTNGTIFKKLYERLASDIEKYSTPL